MIEIHERVVRPKLLAEFIACHHVAGMFEKHCQDLKRLVLQPDSPVVLEEFSCAEINFKRPETGRRGQARMIGHSGPLEWERVYHSK